MKKLDRIFFFVGVGMFISELWKQWYLTFVINDGCYDWWYFPFQLCSLPMYILVFLPWIKNIKIKQELITFLMDFNLLGGIFAFADTSGMHYVSPWLTAHSILWHLLLITIGMAAGILGSCEPSWKTFLHSIIIYGICCTMATIFNLSFNSFGHINMFYINPYISMDQVVFQNLTAVFGNGTAIIAYILATILGAALIHSLWMEKYLQVNSVTASKEI